MNGPIPPSNPRGTETLSPQVLLDKAVLRFLRWRGSQHVEPAAAGRTAAEMDTASALFAKRGWLAAPAAYHRRPPMLRDDDLMRLGTSSLPQRHETVAFASGFRPRDIEPGADRFASNKRNDTVVVRLLRHHDKKAPWVICLHGFGMGFSSMDLRTTGATYLHSKLGFNVAVPVLPLHGPRRSPGDDRLLSIDLGVTLHAISQAVWDIRRLVGWIYDTHKMPVGVYGISLGGYLAALLAAVERIDGVVAAIPFADVPELMAHHHPPSAYLDTLQAAATREVFNVTSPLAMTPLLPPDRCTILAARGDQLIPARQPVELSQKWEWCNINWHSGGHVGFAWSRQAKECVGNRLRSTLLTSIGETEG